MTSVMLVGNNLQFTSLVRAALGGQERLLVSGSAMRRADVVERAVLLRPDVAVIDIDHRLEFGGVDTARSIQRVQPSVNFVFISPYRQRNQLAAFPAGSGLQWSYVLRESVTRPGVLATAISQAAWGIQFIDPAIDRRELGSGDRDLDMVVRPSVLGARSPAPDLSTNRWLLAVKQFRVEDV